MKSNNFFDNTYGQSYIFVNNEKVTEVSKSFIDLTEYSVDELLSKNTSDVFNILRVGPNFNIKNINEHGDYFIFTKNLDVRFVNIDVKEDMHEKVYVFFEKPNSRLNITHPFMEALYSHNEFGIAVFSVPDIILLKANQTILNSLDKPFDNRDNSIGKRLSEIASGWVGSTAENIWRDVLSNQKPFYSDEYMYEFKRGVTYWQTSIIPIFEDYIFKYCIMTLTNITEKVINRKKIEEQENIIKHQKELLEIELSNVKLLQSISTELIYEDNIQLLYEKIVDAAMQIMHSRYASMQIVHTEQDNCDKLQVLVARGFEPEDIKSVEWLDSKATYFSCYRALCTGLRVIVPNITECDYMAGTIAHDFYVQLGINAIQSTPLISRNGRTIGVLSTHWRKSYNPTDGELRLLDVLVRQVADLIEQRQAEIKLRENNEALEKSIEMKDEFLSLLSHEFRTPLNVINCAVQVLDLNYAEEMTDKVKEYMKIIKQNTNRQLRLVNNLLDITRVDAGRINMHKKNIDIVFLTKAITESVYEYASRKGVNVTFVSKISKRIIGIDEEKYERIILNLLSNAIKFTPEGKSIVVNLRFIKGYICVEVKDSGIGIETNKIDLIFEKFGQVDSSLSRQAEGTGLGLTLVKKFVEALGGSVSVKSKLGKGTVFTVLLPNRTVVEEINEKSMINLMDKHLMQTTNIELSDIYL